MVRATLPRPTKAKETGLEHLTVNLEAYANGAVFKTSLDKGFTNVVDPKNQLVHLHASAVHSNGIHALTIDALEVYVMKDVGVHGPNIFAIEPWTNRAPIGEWTCPNVSIHRDYDLETRRSLVTNATGFKVSFIITAETYGGQKKSSHAGVIVVK